MDRYSLPDDSFIRNPMPVLARRQPEVPAGPQMLSPVLLPQLREFLLQLPRRPAVDVLRQFRRRQNRWCCQQQMYMIRGHRPSHDRHVPCRTDLPNQVTRTLCYSRPQDLRAIFRCTKSSDSISGRRPRAHSACIPPSLLFSRGSGGSKRTARKAVGLDRAMDIQKPGVQRKHIVARNNYALFARCRI